MRIITVQMTVTLQAISVAIFLRFLNSVASALVFSSKLSNSYLDAKLSRSSVFVLDTSSTSVILLIYAKTKLKLRVSYIRKIPFLEKM